MQETNKQNAQIDVFDIEEIVSSIWHRRYRVLLSFIAGGMIGVALAISIPDKYASKALIEIEDSVPAASSNPLASVLSESKNTAATQVAIIESKSITVSAIENSSFKFHIYESRLQSALNFINNKLAGHRDFYDPAASPIRVQEFTLPTYWIDEKFSLVVINSDSFTITAPDGKTVSGSFGERTKGGNETYFTIERGGARAGERYSLKVLSEPEALQSFSNRFSGQEIGNTGLLSLSFTAESPEQALSSLKSLLDQFIESDREHAIKTAQDRLDYIESEIPTAVKAMDDAEDALTRFQKDSQVVSIEYETEALLRQVSQIELLLREAQIPKEQERLEGIREELFARLSTIPDNQQHIQNLTRDVEIAQTIYLELMKRVQELRVARASARGLVRVIDEPYAYPKPAGPKRAQITVLTALAVCMIYMGAIVVLHLRPTKVKPQV